jgi:nitrate reductase NapE component
MGFDEIVTVGVVAGYGVCVYQRMDHLHCIVIL